MDIIKFGTSGWRGIIARDFTFDNVRLATQGIADYLKPKSANPQLRSTGASRMILGHDTRFLGREFSLAAAEVLAANGLKPLAVRSRHAHAGHRPHHPPSQGDRAAST